MTQLSNVDLAVLALLALAIVLVERSHRRDVDAPDVVATVIAAAPSCQDIRENRRFAIRRMMIADGSLALGNTWRNDALLGVCPAN